MNKRISTIIEKFRPDNKSGKDKIINIGPFKLLANYDHKLDLFLSQFPAYSQNFPRLCYEILQEKDTNATIIDVGANIGDTAALLRKYQVDNKVFCIEGDELFFSYLQKNATQFNDVFLQKNYLTDKNDNSFYVVKNDRGTAQIVKSEASGVFSNLVTLDELSEQVDFGEIGVIKIDTDGFDSKIIRGALKLIKNFKPVLFFEYDYDLSNMQDESPLETLLLLKDVGYNGIIYFDNYGRTLTSCTLEDVTQLKILDKYIQNGKGSFPYYDVFVFSKEDDGLFKKISLIEAA